MLLETLFRVFFICSLIAQSKRFFPLGQKLVCSKYMQCISKYCYLCILFVLNIIFLMKQECFTNQFVDDVFSDYIRYDYVNSL